LEAIMRTPLALGAILLSATLFACGEGTANSAEEELPEVPTPPVDAALWEELKADSVSLGGGDCEDNIFNCPRAPNPLPAASTVWLEEMTWMDVRDAIAAGKTTAIISTGGIEPNGPWLVLGKHNYVLQTNCEVIARKLGNALCAPIQKLVPEGNLEPQSGHMRSPGTLSLRQETYKAVLTDLAHSLKMHGFQNIIFLGDSGGNQNGQAQVADSLKAAWGGMPVVAHIGEYYNAPPGTPNVLRDLGVTTEDQPSDGLHDSPGITLNMMLTDPNSIRYEERLATGYATINGVSLADREQALEWARQIVEARANRTVEYINTAIASGGGSGPWVQVEEAPAAQQPATPPQP
jgi:creatinine amidohydrolase/Fe(II)-dependent formamide hydrolase-like protein